MIFNVIRNNSFFSHKLGFNDIFSLCFSSCKKKNDVKPVPEISTEIDNCYELARLFFLCITTSDQSLI